MIKRAYTELFKLHGDKAWTLEQNKLITFFRQTDQSSGLVGTLQAKTFSALASYSGHGVEGTTPDQKPRTKTEGKTTAARRKAKPESRERHKPEAESLADKERTDDERRRDLALSVRIEINLPTAADQETYDRIFWSIKENLLNG